MTNTEDSCSKPGARYKLRGAVNELCTELHQAEPLSVNQELAARSFLIQIDISLSRLIQIF